MTQAELAPALGVSQQAVFAYELGDRRVSVLILASLWKVLVHAKWSLIDHFETDGKRYVIAQENSIAVTGFDVSLR